MMFGYYIGKQRWFVGITIVGLNVMGVQKPLDGRILKSCIEYFV